MATVNRNKQKKKQAHNIKPREGSITLLPTPQEALDLAGENKNEVAAVIVSVLGGSSYDSLFRKVPQSSDMGIIYVYSIHTGTRILNNVQKLLAGNDLDVKECADQNELDTLNSLKKHCEVAGHDAVCFNFECCSMFAADHFCSHDREQMAHISLVAFLVKEFGCLCMFSDFSLKALIGDWKEDMLGPNPFVKVGVFGTNFQLTFDCKQLENSASAQLQTLGKLSTCDQDYKATSTVHAMSSTIAYTLKDEVELLRSSNLESLPYDIELLTIATSLETPLVTSQFMQKAAQKPGQLCQLKNDKIQERGLAGHVMLTFPPIPKPYSADTTEEEDEPLRGRILTSCGHWIELMKIDANVERVLEVSKQEWGMNNLKLREWKQSLEDAPEEKRELMANSFSHNIVQSRAPMLYNRKLMKKKGVLHKML